MRVIADLHLHSRFSRAVSKEMTVDGLAKWSRTKGIDLIATGDWTHPIWLRELEAGLVEDGSGFLTQKVSIGEADPKPRFLLSTEISTIFSDEGKTRRVHTLIWVPTIASAAKIGTELTKMGCNVTSDGRPIIGLTLKQLAELVLTAEPTALIVPAHIWTPWFSVYGSMGGYPSLQAAFGQYAKYIYAVETGLSSSPDMNWRIGELDSRSIVSSSDAHSGAKLGREATVFELPKFTFSALTEALQNVQNKPDLAHIEETIEFYPEEGKYHYTGHRDCHIRFDPEETKLKGITCPVCGKPLTQGVMQRVEELATRSVAELKLTEDISKGLRQIRSAGFPNRPPFVMLVPLQEIIAEAIGRPVTSKRTIEMYEKLVTHFGGEYPVLLSASIEEIRNQSTPQVGDGVEKVRKGNIVIDPGYDGVFGVVKIWKDEKERELVDKSKEQLGLF